VAVRVQLKGALSLRRAMAPGKESGSTMRGHSKGRRLILVAVTATALTVVACGKRSDVNVVGVEPAAAAVVAEHRLAGLSADAADRWTGAEHRLAGLSADAADRWTGAEHRLAGLSADAADRWTGAEHRLAGLSADAADRWSTT
jgi:hypothetical protein